MTSPYDDERLASAYEPGNQMPRASLRAWTRLIGGFAARRDALVLDLGTGTGAFAAAMARWLTLRGVVGIDPSVPMLTRARRLNGHGVGYAAGSAAAIPARTAAFDLALLSRVIHHVRDRRACARELARVLRPGGRVVIRTTFRENLDALVYRYWPPLLEIDQRRFPSAREVIDDFAAAGFGVADLTSFAQPVTASLHEYEARMRSRPQSKFTYLTDREFAAGMQALQRDALAAASPAAGAVYERYDVLVLTTR